MSRPIYDVHEALLRTALNITEDGVLPENVVELYWDYARTYSRLGLPIDPAAIAHIVVIAGRAVQDPPTSFLDIAGQLDRGAKVVAKFRNKWRWGQFIEIDEADKRVLVQLDDDTAEIRKFQPTSVRLPTEEELADIGE